MDLISILYIAVFIFLAILAYRATGKKRKIIIVILICMFILGARGFYISPTVKGIIVDSETGQPTEGYIYVTWKRIFFGFGGESESDAVIEKRYVIKNDGTFRIPSRVLINFIPVHIGDKGKFRALLYTHGYEVLIIDDHHIPRKEEIPLSRIFRPWRFHNHLSHIRDAKDDKFTNDEYKLYLKKFGNKRWDRDTQSRLADSYAWMRDYKSAARKIEEKVIDYPHLAKYYKKTLNEYRNKAKQTNTIAKTKTAEELISLLHDKDSQVRSDAANDLIDIGDPRAVEPLIVLLNENNVEARMNAVAAFGNINDPRTIQPLIKSLRDENAVVRELAARSLARKKDPRIYDHLIDALGDKDSDVQRAVLYALGELRDIRALTPLQNIMKKKDFHSTEAVLALWKIGGELSIDTLIETAKTSKYVNEQECAIFLLGEMKAKAAIPVIEEALKIRSDTIRSYASEALSKIRE